MLKKKIVIISICVALVASIGTVGANNMSKADKRIMYENMKKDFDSKLSTLFNIEEDEERTKQGEELKKKGHEIAELEKEVKTQEEFAEELKVALSSTKMGLEDTKLSPDAKTNDETKLFIEKMEKKIARIEKDFAKGNKTPEQLLKELRDRTDID